jgi:hemerythrin superfamily protein
MNVFELLMVEHAVLRIRLSQLTATRDKRLFEVCNRFVLECHARVEDEVAFPLLEKNAPQASRWLGKLEADHRLISTLAANMVSWIKEGKDDLYERRLDTYIKTVVDHNLAEETLVFPLWKHVADGGDALGRAKAIIRGFGEKEYFEFTGISREFYDLF